MKRYTIARRKQSLVLKAVYSFFIFLSLFGGLLWASRSMPALATSNACPVTDGGAGDGDGSVNGVIQISAVTTWTMPAGAYGDFWDCTGKSMLVTNNITFTLVGSTTTGSFPYIKTDNLTVNSGSTITSKGCARVGTADYFGFGPNGSNVCTTNAAGFGMAVYNAPGWGASGAGYGGVGGRGQTSGDLGGLSYGSSTYPVEFGSSGGNGYTAGGNYNGGTGGGIIYLQVTGTTTINGTISANGSNGTNGDGNHASGGGSGGSIYISTGTFAGSTCSLTATGGNGSTAGSFHSGSGSGGRIVVKYNTDSSTCLSALSAATAVAGGTATSPATAGGQGTLQLNPAVTIAMTRAYAVDSNANNQIDKVVINFNTDITSGSIAGTDFSLTGGYAITGASRTDFDQVTLTLTESGLTDVGTSVTASVVGSLSDPLGNTMTSGSIVVNGVSCPGIDGSSVDGDRKIDGVFTVNNGGTTTWTPTSSQPLVCQGIDVWVTGSSTVVLGTDTTNGYYDALKVKNITLDSGSTITSSAGCGHINTDLNGSGPSGTSGACANSAAGFGAGITSGGGYDGASGGGYGGIGGVGSTSPNVQGVTYGSSSMPLQFGSEGGNSLGTAVSSYSGGVGGGVVYITATGTTTINGTISANGANGTNGDINRASGGGSGGSIYISTGTFAGSTCSLTAKGGNGLNSSNAQAGGGGGGRIAVKYTTDSSSCLSGLTAATAVAGGTATSPATAGGQGTFALNPSETISMLRAYASDSNANNKIDKIIIDFNRDIDSASVAGSDFSLSGGYTVSSASRTAFGQVTVVVTEAGAADLGKSLTATVVGSLSDPFGNTITSGSISANGVTCPIIDGGAADNDRKIDGVITVNTGTTWTPTSTTPLACQATDLWITNSASLVFGSDLTNGYTEALKIKNLTIDTGASINADYLGCQRGALTDLYGTGPNLNTNICAKQTAGFANGSTGAAGAGYGGIGGEGSNSGNGHGLTYGNSSLPTLFGSAGGSSLVNSGGTLSGANGGGVIYIFSTGTTTLNGSITANGANGTNYSTGWASGAGSGGSIFLYTNTFAGSGCAITAKGGVGANNTTAKGGGGGGGRVALYYGTDSTSCLSGLAASTVVTGGSATSTATAGSTGTFYKQNTATPTILSLGSIAQATDGSDKVTFTTSVIDSDSVSKLKVEYSEDGGSTWKDPYLTSATVNSGTVDLDNAQTYQIGTVDGIDTGGATPITVTVTWDSKSSSNDAGNGGPAGYQNDIQVRVTPGDGTNTGATLPSTNFTLDNAAPAGLASFANNNSAIGTAILTWTAATDNVFNHYEIWYGTNQSDVQNRTGTATKWDNANDASLGTATTTTTTITGLNSNTTYYYKIWAVDANGNAATLSDINTTTQNLSNWTSYQVVRVTNNIASLLTNYQVKISIPFANLPGMDANCNDVRVLDTDQKTEVAHWTDTCSTNVLLWAKLPSLAASATQSYYLYYNNSVLDTSDSNGDQTFIDFIDENDIARWSSTVPVVSTNFTRFNDNTGAAAVNTTIALKAAVDSTQNFVMEMRWKAVDMAGGNDQSMVSLSAGSGTATTQVARTGAPFTTDQTAFGYGPGGSNVGLTAMGSTLFSFGTFFRTKVEVIRSSTLNNQYVYSDNYSLLASHASNAMGTTSYSAANLNVNSTTADVGDFYADFFLFRQYASTEPTVSIGVAPNTPSITSPSAGATGVSVNPLITSSADSGTGTQTQADWQISDDNTFSNSDCSDTNIVWCSMSDQTNLTSVTPGPSVGTFSHALSGLTGLGSNSTYYVRTRHTNPGGSSSWSSSVAFTSVNGIRPVASGTSVNAGASAVTLTENTTTTVTATTTVTDNDGCSDIGTVSAKFYRTDIGAGASDDENNHYTVASCTQDAGSCNGGLDTTATYTCNFSVYYYADPTDPSSINASTNWTATVTPNDGIGVGSTDSDTIEMNTLAALHATSSISFGSIAINNHTGSTNQVTTIINTGNVNIDTMVSGTNMVCSSGTIPVSYIKYRPQQGFTIGSNETALSLTPTEVNINIPQRTGPVTSDNFYWGFRAPINGVGGSCSATLTFTPVADPFVD